MQFPQTAEYALRAMAAMAARAPDSAARATDLAAQTGIPQHYLSKVLRRLVTAGLLASQRGHGGGFVLARDAAQITFHEVLDAVDYFADGNPCVFGWSSCDGKHPCPLHDSWSVLKENFTRWSEETVLSSVSRAPTRPPKKKARASLVQLGTRKPASAARTRR